MHINVILGGLIKLPEIYNDIVLRHSVVTVLTLRNIMTILILNSVSCRDGNTLQVTVIMDCILFASSQMII